MVLHLLTGWVPSPQCISGPPHRRKLAVASGEGRSHTEKVINPIRSSWRAGRRHHPLPAILISLVGMGVCAAALIGFVVMVATNNLPWHPDWTVQDHYLEIGRSYSQGFIIGFFLCFFLIMGSVSLSAWIENRRRSQAASNSSSSGVRAA